MDSIPCINFLIIFWQGFLNRVTQREILNVQLSDHQLISWTRKITRIKKGGHKEIRILSLKNYTVDGYEKSFGKVKFPSYKKLWQCE